MSAPNTSAQANVMGWPISRAASQTPAPTAAVEITVPKPARIATGIARLRSLPRST